MTYIKKTYMQMAIDSYKRAEEEYLVIEEVDDTRCIVMNMSKGTLYTVMMSEDRIEECNCPHYIYRNVLCKHMIVAAKFFNKLI